MPLLLNYTASGNKHDWHLMRATGKRGAIRDERVLFFKSTSLSPHTEKASNSLQGSTTNHFLTLNLILTGNCAGAVILDGLKGQYVFWLVAC